MAGATARTEFSQALRAIATERGLDADVILETIKQAYVAAFKRDARERGENVEEFGHDAEIDPITGEARIMQWEVNEETGEATSEKKDVTPPGFGRIAAQTAKQVIHQKIREAEKDALLDEYSSRVGTLVSGVVLRFDGANVRVDLGRSEAIMPADERVPSERLNPSQRLTFLLKEITDTPRGKQLVLSRIDPEFVYKVFAREVPEIASGSVEIKGLAREPGVRTKIAVFSSQSGVDPVGSCVGQKGVRVQAVTNELGGERVDIIPWTENREEFIKATLAPVDITSLKMTKNDEGQETAIIVVPDDQLSLAIGKDGQNVRLASKITGVRIEVEGAEGKPAPTEAPADEKPQESEEIEETQKEGVSEDQDIKQESSDVSSESTQSES